MYEREQAIWNEARAAAQAASDHSESIQQSWYPCGFASFIIRPARGKFVTFLKKAGIGGSNYGGGYRISSYDLCSQSPQWCQSMNVKEDALRAAYLVFAKYNISGNVEARMD
jgi:hypothetical protein